MKKLAVPLVVRARYLALNVLRLHTATTRLYLQVSCGSDLPVYRVMWSETAFRFTHADLH